MKNVLILGAAGRTMKVLEQQLLSSNNIHLTLLLHHKNQINLPVMSVESTVITGDVMDSEILNQAIKNQDAVVVGLGGKMVDFINQIFPAMHKNHVSRLIYILGLGIYDEVHGKFGEWSKSVDPNGISDFKAAAKLIEDSDLNYTILRPGWMSDRTEINYETTQKGEQFRGTVITRASIADYIVKLLNDSNLGERESVGLDEPGTDGDSPYPFM
ncbi:NAD(P)H-binding protein [Pediococcus argentinicus]|uniref:NAD(P)-binding domain-containing protein n=1 Tax=Pediococcus argentinicus TaxID=480391 RepID=A0A0R2NGF5_9LACO|nr:NAD(P)H-binding protein [Pediococcus argentinicus]KRO24886.1 hypothetical protein IV88_GL000550 [Pediococcus argentinicus]NKZ22583.1 NAD(P)H-binding protein [Pediococcus argentinicus]GEP19756.1 NAD-dependent dehydratase [Pediococcus argentinicus]